MKSDDIFAPLAHPAYEVELNEGDNRSHTFGRACNAFGLLVGAMGNAAILFLNWDFYSAARHTPPGTYIRPMALVLYLFSVGIGSSLLGASSLELGTRLCKRIGDEGGDKLGRIAEVVCTIPLPLAVILFNLITAVCGLKLAG